MIVILGLLGIKILVCVDMDLDYLSSVCWCSWLLLPSYTCINQYFKSASSLFVCFIVYSALDISIAFFNKKRKLEDELLGMPMSKHACWGHRLVCNFPSDSTIESKMVRRSICVRGVESASSSSSFPGDDDMSDDAKTHLSYPKAYAFVEAAAASDDSSSQIGPSASSISREVESPSICEELHCLYREYGLKLPDKCDDHLLEFGCHSECSLCVDESVDYVLSSGRGPVNQDGEEGAKKLTIDKEFELYFSALMLAIYSHYYYWSDGYQFY